MLLEKVLERDETVVENRELAKIVRLLNGSKFKLSPEIRELRDLLLETHGVVEESLEKMILEHLYKEARPKYYRDEPSKLMTRFAKWEAVSRLMFRAMMFRDKAELARDYELVDFELFDKLQSLNRHRNNFSHNDMGKMNLYKDEGRKKNLLELMRDILMRI